MLYTLTDEEWVVSADEQIERVAQAIAATCTQHPGTSIEALSQVLWVVNGKNWMGGSDMARAKVRAKALGAGQA